jgi:hypothetical protein
MFCATDGQANAEQGLSAPVILLGQAQGGQCFVLNIPTFSGYEPACVETSNGQFPSIFDACKGLNIAPWTLHMKTERVLKQVADLKVVR